MKNALKAGFAIAAKDFRIERRSKEVFTTMIVFAFIVIVIFSFAFEPTAEETRRIAGGLLWVAFTFAGILGLSRSFARETTNECLQGLLLTPAGPGAVYLGKLGSNVAFMLAAEAVVLPVFMVFYNIGFGSRFSWLVGILLLGTWGFASITTTFSAITANTRMRELMLPVLVLPISVPLLIAMVEATATWIAGEPMREAYLWLRLMAGFDVIFTVASLLVFPYVVED